MRDLELAKKIADKLALKHSANYLVFQCTTGTYDIWTSDNKQAILDSGRKIVYETNI